MDGKNTIPASVEKSINDQIAFHKDQIKSLEFTLKMMKEFPPQPAVWMKTNSPLTRDLIRVFMENIKKPVRTVDAIDILYPTYTDEKRSHMIKKLSVVFNQMEKEGEIKIEKKKGVKGNYYTWIKK